MNKKLLTSFLAVFVMMFWGYNQASAVFQSQDSLGGPYSVDSATVLLLHFDGNTENASDLSADPVESGNLSFVSNMEGAGSLNRQLRIDNDSPQDSSWMTVADTAALDLTGSWTLELWINVFTYGNTEDDWRIGPRPIFKPGDPDEGCYCYSNYFFNIYGVEQNFNTGYYADQSTTWIEVRSESNLLRVGEWYHLTFIRDTSKNVILQMIHQTPDKGMTDNSEELELTYFASQGYDGEEDHPPRVNDQPLYIGASPQNDFSIGMLDGFLDEIRISNVVRNFTVPPIIKDVRRVENQQSGQDIEIEANIQTIGEAAIEDPKLFYRVNESAWDSTGMVEDINQTYSATIPSQNVGANVDYWIKASTDQGLTATNPTAALSDSTYHSFGVEMDSSRVLGIDFDGLNDGEMPVDSSLYELGIEYGGSASPTYESGAMQFSAADSTLLELESPFLALDSFGIETTFMFTDSVPEVTEPRIYAKRNGAIYQSNYQIYFRNGSVRPATRIPQNDCEGFLGGALHMTEAQLEPGKWYTAGFGLSAERDTVFAWVKDTEADTLMAMRGTCATEPPSTGGGPLYIGAQDEGGPYFNGQIDHIDIFNYAPPNLYVATSIDDRSRTTLPRRVALDKNYPNPFNPSTNITYTLPRATETTLAVYNLLGRRVATLVDETQKAGTHSVEFDASNLSSGVYIYRLMTDEANLSRKMMLLK